MDGSRRRAWSGEGERLPKGIGAGAEPLGLGEESGLLCGGDHVKRIAATVQLPREFNLPISPTETKLLVRLSCFVQRIGGVVLQVALCGWSRQQRPV